MLRLLSHPNLASFTQVEFGVQVHHATGYAGTDFQGVDQYA